LKERHQALDFLSDLRQVDEHALRFVYGALQLVAFWQPAPFDLRRQIAGGRRTRFRDADGFGVCHQDLQELLSFFARHAVIVVFTCPNDAMTEVIAPR
jgi:hypothetical protein